MGNVDYLVISPKFSFLKLTCALGSLPASHCIVLDESGCKWNVPGFPSQPLGLTDEGGRELRINRPPVWVWGAELDHF